MAIEYFKGVRHYHVSITGPTMNGSRERFLQDVMEKLLLRRGRMGWCFKEEEIPQLGSSPTANQDLSTMLLAHRKLFKFMHSGA